MKVRRVRKKIPFLSLFAGALISLATLDTGEIVVGQASAVIGRPLTPVSYAGVARRTSRRTTRRTLAYSGAYGAYGYGAYGAYGAAATAAAIATLPYGCGRISYAGGVYYNCAGTYYRPVYDGPDVVYIVTDRPD